MNKTTMNIHEIESTLNNLAKAYVNTRNHENHKMRKTAWLPLHKAYKLILASFEDKDVQSAYMAQVRKGGF